MNEPLEVRKSKQFDRWLRKLKDLRTRRAILIRVSRLEESQWGDVVDVGEGVFELRMFGGPGYRIYGTRIGAKIVLILCGGDKGSQQRDIAKAKLMAKRLREGGLYEED